MTPDGRCVVVCPPSPSGEGYWARRTHQHLEQLAGSGWLVDLRAPDGGPGEASLRRADIVLAVGWSAAEVASAAFRGVPQLVDAGEVQFPVSARRSLAGPGTATILGERFGELLARELATYASAAAVIVASRPEADLLDDFLGRPGSVKVVPPSVDAAPPPAARRHGLLFVADLNDDVDADAAAWLGQRMAPLLPATFLANHPLSVVAAGGDAGRSSHVDLGRASIAMCTGVDAISHLAAARLVLVPPLLGARGYDLALRALIAGAQVVAPARVRDALDPLAREGVHVAHQPAEFAAAVVEALQPTVKPLSRAVGEALLNAHSPSRARTALLAALEGAADRPTGRGRPD